MKRGLGYIFWGEEKKDKDLKAFKRIAKKKNIELIVFNLDEIIQEKELREKAEKCSIIFNNSTENIGIELVKTLEQIGARVVDSSKTFYYTEDKWMFFLKCKKSKIPVPDTILLSEDINLVEKELKEFAHWPIILKRVEGCGGEYVEKANNISQVKTTIKKFWKKGNERLPIIAQEFIESPSYRVTVIGGKIIQTAIKDHPGWKKTGCFSNHFKKLEIDEFLEKLIKKVVRAMAIQVCGIDLLKKDGKWVVLEINAEPGLDFFIGEREHLVEEILSLLIKKSKN